MANSDVAYSREKWEIAIGNIGWEINENWGEEDFIMAVWKQRREEREKVGEERSDKWSRVFFKIKKNYCHFNMLYLWKNCSSIKLSSNKYMAYHIQVEQFEFQNNEQNKK